MPAWYLDRPQEANPTERWQQILAQEQDQPPLPEPPHAGARTLVAIDTSGRIAGVSMIGLARDDDMRQAGELWMIYVHPSAWGTGLAAVLHNRSLQYLGHWHYEEAMLWVAAGNARARRFYQRHGWYIDGDPKVDDMRGFALSEVRYRIGVPPIPTSDHPLGLA
ncbi:MAG TPA: GNAT family N-acetyltransferase [Mycobacteriales bacterium]|nr:GNAT family N-acetyltransferase [Mycobacteriales bacterium]